jgi:hypothetical protein
MKSSLTSPAPRLASIIALALAVACGSSDPAPPAGTGGAGGSSKGGSGGTGTGGTGTGGSGTGGMATGGTGSGGAASGGTSGTGGSPSGGAGGTAPDGGSSDVPSASYLDDCFSGLRALAATSQVSNKRSSNGAYEVRIALEVPPGGVGTSGTKPWKAVRLGIVTPQKRVCIKDEAALVGAYKGSLHNCKDALTVTVDGLVYKLDLPDTDPNRAPTTLSVTGEAAILPVMLPTVSCTTKSGAACTSGGPC